MMTLTMIRQELMAAFRYTNRQIWDGNLPEPFILHTLKIGSKEKFEMRDRPTILFSGKSALKKQKLSIDGVAEAFGEMKKFLTKTDSNTQAIKETLKSFKELQIF